ncbi:MAG TPA: histidine kinase, partial [Chitinophagales bacterium]|nr:histidine kinase [Chitinophagales bacterium]
QIVFWSAFLALPYFMSPRPSDENAMNAFQKHYVPLPPDLTQNMFLSWLAYNCCLIIFFYFHHYFLFDRFVRKKQFLAYGLVTIGLYIFIFFISFFYKSMLFPSMHAFHPFFSFHEFIKTSTWFLLVLLISLGIKLMGEWQQAEQRALDIENDQLRTELSFLHAQINPHFLFNSLNTIYSLALKKSDAAPTAVLKLSKLLRYVVDEAGVERVSLTSEVDYLNNYIELQKLRSTSTLQVNFETTGNLDAVQIAPLLFLPFVENAFKYGISNHEESPIDIKLAVQNNLLSFSVKNRKFKDIESHSTGTGINNTQRRLALLYPAKHKLVINDTDTTYLLALEITLV